MTINWFKVNNFLYQMRFLISPNTFRYYTFTLAIISPDYLETDK